MPSKSVFCFATSRTQAGQIVDQLKAARFSSNNISALIAARKTSHDFAHERFTKAHGGAMAGAVIVGILGGVLGWIAGIGVLTIPGFGSYAAAGPLLAALSGVAMGAVVGGIGGGLIGLGFPGLEAKRYEDKLRDGNILISVHTENASEITQAEVIFAHSGGQGICTTEVAAGSGDDRATEILTYPPESGLKAPAR